MVVQDTKVTPLAQLEEEVIRRGSPPPLLPFFPSLPTGRLQYSAAALTTEGRVDVFLPLPFLRSSHPPRPRRGADPLGHVLAEFWGKEEIKELIGSPFPSLFPSFPSLLLGGPVRRSSGKERTASRSRRRDRTIAGPRSTRTEKVSLWAERLRSGAGTG